MKHLIILVIAIVFQNIIKVVFGFNYNFLSDGFNINKFAIDMVVFSCCFFLASALSKGYQNDQE